MGKKIYLLKLGGSVITDTSKISTPRLEAISRLIKEIKNAKSKQDFSIIIGHGAGSFGHITAKQYKLHEGLGEKDSMRGLMITHQAMRELNKLVVQAADTHDLSPYPFTPSSFAHSSSRKIAGGNLEGMRTAINQGFTPIVHGDGMFDSQQGVSIASTEEVFRFITGTIKPDKIIIGTDIDGVYDKDPNIHADAKLIERVDSSNIDQIVQSTGGARKVDVTGGMKTKISMLHEMVKNTGSEGYIANAGKEGVIENLLLGNEVTCTKVRA